MRDLIIFGIVLWFSLQGLVHPGMGILGWTWVSIMSPHRMAYGFIQSFPVAMMVGGATLVGLVVSRDRKRLVATPETVFLILFMIWITLGLATDIFFDTSFEMWKRVMKIDLMILVAAMVINSRKLIIGLAWTLAISIGYYGAKGGLFTILTGGSFKVWGPEASFIEGNNEVALAITMTIPLIRFVQLHGGIKHKLLQQSFTVWMVLCAFAALGSQSRGAMLALAGVGFFFWMKSKKKVLSGVLIAICAVALVAFMPASWSDRMSTVKTYDQDSSAMGRINAWNMAYNVAKDRVFGTGFENFNAYWFRLYAPNPADLHAPHSIYFQVMGEQGFVGFFLFVGIWIAVWRGAGKLKKLAKPHPEAAWCEDLASLCQVSLAGYLVGGAFLGLASWDYPYNLLVLVVAARQWVIDKAWEREPPPEGFSLALFGWKKKLPVSTRGAAARRPELPGAAGNGLPR